MPGVLMTAPAGAAPGPPAADSQWTMSLGTGSYSWTAVDVAAVGGDVITGAGLALDQATMQIPAAIVSAIDETVAGVDFTNSGTASAGLFPCGSVSTDMNYLRTVAKLGVVPMNPRGQFDFQARFGFPTAPSPNQNRAAAGILFWEQGSSNYESRGVWWGFGGVSSTGGVMNSKVVLNLSSDPGNSGEWWDEGGTGTTETGNEYWVRVQRDSTGAVIFSYRYDSGAWITPAAFATGGWPWPFTGGEVSAGFGFAFGNGGVYRVSDADLTYLAVP